VPLLVVYGLVESHRDTSEWSAQGLGASMATLVEAGWRGEMGARVLLCEERVDGVVGRDGGGEDVGGGHGDEGEGEKQWWEERIPMLSGSVRRDGMEGETGWSGRTVEIGRVLGRWCRFGKGDWDDVQDRSVP